MSRYKMVLLHSRANKKLWVFIKWDAWSTAPYHTPSLWVLTLLTSLFSLFQALLLLRVKTQLKYYFNY